MPHPNIHTSPTKIKCVITQLLIMECDGCSLISEKINNSNVIKVVTKLTYITHPLD